MVKVYVADVTPLKEEGLYNHLYTQLDDKRRAKADRFVFNKDKMLCVGAGALLAIALKEEGIDSFLIETGNNGKPYLRGNCGIHFNLSHSGCMVMCVVADTEVGCDVEQKAVLDKDLAEYAMTERELEYIYQFKEYSKQQDMFFRIWTLKESYMKVTGLGMQLPLQDFSIDFKRGKGGNVPFLKGREVYFKEYFRDDGYCYSCCSLLNEFSEKMREVDLSKMH